MFDWIIEHVVKMTNLFTIKECLELIGDHESDSCSDAINDFYEFFNAARENHELTINDVITLYTFFLHDYA